MKTAGSFITSTNVDDLTERISVRNYITQRNERGDILNAVEFERCEVWAKILPYSSRINDGAPMRSNTVSYRVAIRYRTDVKPDDEIIWRGRRLKIITPPYDAESRKIYTVMDCEGVIENAE